MRHKGMMLAAVAVAGLPALLLVGVLGVRSPVRYLVALYAALVPIGSAVVLPLGLPAPYNTLSTLGGVAMGAGLCAHLALSHRGSPRLLTSVPLWALFVGVSGLTFVWSVDPNRTIGELAFLVALVSLYVLTAMTPVTRRDVEAVEFFIVLGAVLLSALGLFLLATGTLPITDFGQPRFGAAGGELGNANISAAILVLPLVVAGGRALHTSRPRTRCFFAVAVLLIVAALVLTASRGGALAAFAALAVLTWNERRRKPIAVFSLLGLVVAAAVMFSAPPQVRQRVLEKRDPSGRVSIWKVGLQTCPDYCLLGSGWGTFGEVYDQAVQTTVEGPGLAEQKDAHNSWLRALVENGLLGLGLMAVAFAFAVRDLLGLPRIARGPPLAGLAGLAVSNMFLSTLTFKYFWFVFMYAALVTLAYSRVGRGNEESRPAEAIVAGGS